MELYTTAHFTGLRPPAVASVPLCTASLAPLHRKVFQRPRDGWRVSQLLAHSLTLLEQSPLSYDNPECRKVKLGNAVWVFTYFLLTESPPLSRSQSNFLLLPCSCACSLALSLIADEKGHCCCLYRGSFLRDLYLSSRCNTLTSALEWAGIICESKCPACLSGCLVMSYSF